MKKVKEYHRGYRVIAHNFERFLLSTNEKEILASFINPLLKDVRVFADIGSGTGDLTARLTSSGRLVIAVEPCKEYLPYLNKNLSNSDHLIIPRRIENVELPKSSLDAVVFSHSLTYMKDFDANISKALSWIKVGGVGIFVILSEFGDQAQIMKSFWGLYHPNSSPIYPSVTEIESSLSEMGQIAHKQKVTSTIHAPYGPDFIKILSFILEISPNAVNKEAKKMLEDHLQTNIVDDHYQITTDHEIIFFRKGRDWQ